MHIDLDRYLRRDETSADRPMWPASPNVSRPRGLAPGRHGRVSQTVKGGYDMARFVQIMETHLAASVPRT
jgi:hypothetical protein